MRYFTSILLTLLFASIGAQSILGDFTSIAPLGQSSTFVFPDGFRFQKLIETGDPLTAGGSMQGNHDYTGYVPISGSSTNGYVSINKENTPGGVSILEMSLNVDKLWEISSSQNVDFSGVAGTARNCSGAVTPWNTVVTCEEVTSGDGNSDGYNDLGWCAEIDPVSKSVLNKLWALGNFKHENIVVHSNERTVYLGADSNPGYLFKFVADAAQDLNSGALYVYEGSKSGAGNWLILDNDTPAERNSTLSQCNNLNATVFNGVEDVDIGPDGLVYFAVKNEDVIYRFQDSDPLSGTTVSAMETFVGGINYDITHSAGTVSIPWGSGNDNLAFDSEGNLWVCQDGDDNYIWVVKAGHTQANPKVEIFAASPSGSEPTGLTFSPDHKYMFLSIQHPSSSNNSSAVLEASGNEIYFDKNISIVMSKSENLGVMCVEVGQPCNDGDSQTFDDVLSATCECVGTPIVQERTYSISTSSDDFEENTSSNNVDYTSTDLELTFDIGRSRTQGIGLRFLNIDLDKSKLIEEAYIQFTTKAINSQPTSLEIKCVKEANVGAFSGDNVLTSLLLTTSMATWNDVPAWDLVGEHGAKQRSPDLSEIINELRNETEFIGGNALSFIIRGSGTRSAISYDNDPAEAPKLVIKYAQANINNIGISSAFPKSKLEVNQGDIYLKSLGTGVIIKSPDGNCWRLEVENNGNVKTKSVVCPE